MVAAPFRAAERRKVNRSQKSHPSLILRRIRSWGLALLCRRLEQPPDAHNGRRFSRDVDDAVRHQQGLGRLVEKNHLDRFDGGATRARGFAWSMGNGERCQRFVPRKIFSLPKEKRRRTAATQPVVPCEEHALADPVCFSLRERIDAEERVDLTVLTAPRAGVARSKRDLL